MTCNVQKVIRALSFRSPENFDNSFLFNIVVVVAVPFVFSMSRFQGPAFRCDKIVVIVTLLEAIEGIPDKDYNFGENENFHNFTRDYFMSENLRVNT